MPRPRTREDGGEAQWGKVEVRRGVPREQVGESLLDRGREDSRFRQGFNEQSQVNKLPANLTEVIEGRREGGALGISNYENNNFVSENLSDQISMQYANAETRLAEC